MAVLHPFKKFAALGSPAGGFCRRNRRHGRPGDLLHVRQTVADQVVDSRAFFVKAGRGRKS
jgi:hypothetical protein